MLKNRVYIMAFSMAGLLFQSVAWAQYDSSNSRLYQKLSHRIEHSNKIAEFSQAEIFLEQNFSDGDTEVVLKAKGGDAGIKMFWVFSPQGKLIYKFHSPANGRNIGGREIIVESPEPADLSIVLNAYPQGEYTYIGKTFDGQWLRSYVELLHDIPPPVSISFPLNDSTISRFDFEITWESTVEAKQFLVELQNEETELELLVQVDGQENNFRAPEEWLLAGSEYQLSVGIINEAGNLTFVEQSIFTMEE